ncbi:MAG: hypothetical protein WC107_04095 [Patescibacteria group bacterium]
MKFTELEEFSKDYKKLCRKYPSLPTDLNLRQEVLAMFPTGRGNDAVQIPGLKIKSKIFKTRLMCRSVKGKSFRLIYHYDDVRQEIILIELYFKGDKELEDRDRLFNNFS